MDIEFAFYKYKEATLHGQYLPFNSIMPIIKKQPELFSIVGHSVLGKPIYAFTIGNGPIKILMWSQMHGNESTTTKALFDFLNFLKSGEVASEMLLKNFTFLCLPMLNPDGAEVYTRENANGVDLNRDASNLTQPESLALRKSFAEFKPDFCYNLHDQRTIYGVGNTAKPATVSFLAPAYNAEREFNSVRKEAIRIIVAMNEELQQHIPGQVGRFDDTFNICCVGDTFQSLNVPTILFEAGHFQGDYEREETRKYIFIALVSGLNHINENVIVDSKIEDYLNIPQNKIAFYDFVYKNVKINYDSNKIIANFGLQYDEVLSDNTISYKARFAEIGNLDHYFGHFEYNANEAEYSDDSNNIPEVGQPADFYLGKDFKVVNGALVSND